MISVPRAGSGHHHRDACDDAYEHENTCLMLCRMSGGGLVKIRIDMLSDRPHNMAGIRAARYNGLFRIVARP